MIGTFIYISRLAIGLTAWFCKANVMSKKLTVLKLHSMVMASPHCLKVLTISFFFLSIIDFEIPQKFPRLSSRYKPMSFLSITDPSWLRIKEPTSSQISAPSKHPMGTSKSFLPSFFTYGSECWKRSNFLESIIIEYSSSVIFINDFA